MTSRWRWWSLEKLDQGCPIEHLRRLTESLTTDSQQGLRHTPNGQPTLGPQQRPIREGTVSFYPVRIGNAIRQVELPGLQALNNSLKVLTIILETARVLLGETFFRFIAFRCNKSFLIINIFRSHSLVLYRRITVTFWREVSLQETLSNLTVMRRHHVHLNIWYSKFILISLKNNKVLLTLGKRLAHRGQIVFPNLIFVFQSSLSISAVKKTFVSPKPLQTPTK